MKFRFGTRSLLIVCTLVAAFFPFRNIYQDWFRSSYSGYHIHKVLGKSVTDGDSFEYVSTLFDRHEPRTKLWIDESGPRLLNQRSVFADHKNGDEYYLFFINGGNVNALFQFRNGVVVNHLNSLYQRPYSWVRNPKDLSPCLLYTSPSPRDRG